MSTLPDVSLTRLNGDSTSLDAYRGKVLLIFNAASLCGLTPQYTGLETLYQRYKDRGLVVLGFPTNDFAGQEPGTDEEIARFCATEYPVTFPMFSKVVSTGPDKHPLYAALIAAAPTRQSNNDELRTHLSEYASAHGFAQPNALPELLWNFEKFLVGRDGQVIARFNPDMAADDPAVRTAIEEALR